MKSTFLCLILLITSMSIAKPNTKNRKLASVEQKIVVKTTFGDRVTTIIATNTKDGATISLSSSEGHRKENPLKKNDFEFIISEYEKLPVPRSVPADCYRARIDIEIYQDGKQTSKKESCFGMKTITEPHYVRFSRILMSAL